MDRSAAIARLAEISSDLTHHYCVVEIHDYDNEAISMGAEALELLGWLLSLDKDSMLPASRLLQEWDGESDLIEIARAAKKASEGTV